MDYSYTHWLVLIAITLIGAVAQTAIGFGFALITVPVFLLVLNVDIAIQLAMVLSLTITVVMIFVVYRDIPKTTAKNLLVGTLFGLPLGYGFYLITTPEIIKTSIAICILVALILTAVKKRYSSSFPDTRFGAASSGIVSGAMVTSMAMAGPAIAIYATAIGLNKSATRAIIFSVFLFSYTCAILVHSVFHGFGKPSILLSAYLLPVTLIGAFIGHRLAGKISENMFSLLINVTLVIVAICLIYSSM